MISYAKAVFSTSPPVRLRYIKCIRPYYLRPLVAMLLVLCGFCILFHQPYGQNTIYEDLFVCPHYDFKITKVALPSWSPWKRLPGRDLFVFSSYFDDRLRDYGPLVRVIGVASETCPVFCSVRYRKGGEVCLSSKADTRLVVDNPYQDHTHQVYFYLCVLPDSAVPDEVALSSFSNCSRKTPYIKVHHGQLYSSVNFTWCLSPIFNFTDPALIAEAIEMNRLLGAERIMMFNQSMSDPVAQVLQKYIDAGVVILRNWHWPTEMDLIYYGQNLAINECLYNNMYSTKYLVLTDLDEFIIPLKHTGWNDLVKSVAREDAAGYIARNTFILEDYKTSEESFCDRKTHMFNSSVAPRALTYHNRTVEVFKAIERSKYIADPKRIVQIRIHYLHYMLPGTRQYEFSLDQSILYHKKSHRFMRHVKKFEHKTFDYFQDYRLRPFGEKMIKNFRNALKNVSCL